MAFLGLRRSLGAATLPVRLLRAAWNWPLLLCLVLNPSLRGEDHFWQESAQEAAMQVDATGKKLLVLFTDDVHCASCKRFAREILRQDTFQTYSMEELVLLLVPCSLEHRQALVDDNEILREGLDVEAYPTWWLIDHDFTPLQSGGYVRGGAERFVKLLNGIPRTEVTPALREYIRGLFLSESE